MFAFITDLIGKGGYLGIFLLMILENVFPPIPSELIMPFAGYEAALGDLSLPLVILAGSLGSLIGVWLWYELARWLGTERLRKFAVRHGRLLTLSPRDLDKADHWFDQHEGKVVLFGRCLPGIRTLISIPAGIFGMSRSRFLIYSAIGIFIWTAALAGAGFALRANYNVVENYVNPVSTGLIALLVITYIVRVLRWRPD
jgi:membrane protein DedA with SNARE-associated domain